MQFGFSFHSFLFASLNYWLTAPYYKLGLLTLLTEHKRGVDITSTSGEPDGLFSWTKTPENVSVGKRW